MRVGQRHDLKENRLTTGGVVFAIVGIYVTQTLVSTLAMQSIPALVRSTGGSLTLIGASTLFMLPWALKFIWAPLIERRRLPIGLARRRSRSLILGGQTALVLLLLLAALSGYLNRSHPFQTTEIIWLFALFMMAGLVAATIDIACDGFCVDQLAGSGYGWGNVAQVGGSYVGMMLGGGVFLLLTGRYGWPAAAMLLALMILALTAPLWRVREPDRPDNACHRPSLRYALTRDATRFGLLLIVCLNAGLRVVMPLSAPLLLDHGLSMTSLGWLLGGGSIAAGAAGTLGGGLLIHYWGLWRALWIAYTLQGVMLSLVALSLWLAPSDITLGLLMGLTVAQFMVTACALVCVYSVLMRLSSSLQAGVDFTLFQCADAGIAILAGSVGGMIAQQFGYAACFLAAACLTVLMTLAVAMRRRDFPAGI
ncbi:MFS transporter [Brenneria sp. g21c3]|uniref:MFS transporter n=1 Tax=Brenneria sp. g21c3 TaxID=3093893 RepID=UPI002E9DD5D7|nr:MFS transporter [Brenneria sp. g21c3]